MIFENLDIFICSIGAIVGLISVAIYWVYIGESARKVEVSSFSTYAKFSNLIYLTSLLIIGFQWLTTPKIEDLAKILLMILCIIWVLNAILTLILSIVTHTERIRGTLPHCILKVLLTVVTFWLVS